MGLRGVFRRARGALRGIRSFLLYDAATFIYAVMMIVYLWMSLEYFFLVVLALIKSRFGFNEGQLSVIFALLHSLLLFGIARLYIKLKEGIDSMSEYLRERGIVYTLHSKYWEELFMALFSAAVSLYVLALVILVAYVMYPEKMKESMAVPQAVLYLVLVSYLPLIFLLQKMFKLGLYAKHVKRLRYLFVPDAVQKNN